MRDSSSKIQSSSNARLGLPKRVGRATAISAVAVVASAATVFASVTPAVAPVAAATQVGSPSVAEPQLLVVGEALTTDGKFVSANGAKGKGKGYKVEKWQGIVPRWDSCSAPYTVKVSTPGLKKKARPKAMSEVRWATKNLSKAMGVKFKFKGRTKEVPHAKKHVKTADVVISYVKPRQAKSFPLAGSYVGYGGAWWTGDGRRMSGFVVIDVPQSKRMPLSRRGGATRPSVLMHELGHVVGLAHVKRLGEQMYPTITKRSPKTFGSGDRKGLRRVGAKAGCVR